MNDYCCWFVYSAWRLIKRERCGVGGFGFVFVDKEKG